MAKTRMPKPVAFRSKDTPYLFSLGGPETTGFDGLITTDQAEAYVQARLTAALQEAIDKVSMHGGSVEIEAAIRALIPEDAR